ncbi:MAG: AEC family transporter [Ruminococcaceae bacterium]|nr:AEC family transporter [Oscillospiraceae bacterium]
MQLFLEYIPTAFVQVATLAVLIVVGFTADKAHIYSEKTARATNDLLFYIITPSVIVNSFLNVELTAENGLGFLTAAAIAVVFHTLLSLIVPLLYRKAGKDQTVFRFGTMYGNVGYMGLPLAQAVAGDMGVFYASAAVAVFNIFAFTHGVRLMDRENGAMNWKKLIINPGAIGILIGLPLFLLNVKLPTVIAAPIGYLGSMNTPLAMLMLGTYLAHTDLPDMFKRKENYLAAFLKLLVWPLVGITALYVIGIRSELLLACSVFLAAPTATNTVMFSAKYGHDAGVASKLCGFTTMLAILTMPVCMALAKALG